MKILINFMENIKLFEQIYFAHLNEANNGANTPNLDNWRGTDRSLADLLAEYLTDPTLTMFVKSDWTDAEVYPVVTTRQGTSYSGWTTIEQAAIAVINGDIPGLKDKERIRPNVNDVSKNILKAICGFDPGFNPDDLSSGSLRGTAYYGIWELKDESDGSKFSDNWSDIYMLFHNNNILYNRQLGADLKKFGRIHRDRVLKTYGKYQDIITRIIEALPDIEQFFDLFNSICYGYCDDLNELTEFKNFVQDHSEIFSLVPFLVNTASLDTLRKAIGTTIFSNLKKALEASSFNNIKGLCQQWHSLFGYKDTIDMEPIYRELADKIQTCIDTRKEIEAKKAEEQAEEAEEKRRRDESNKQRELNTVNELIDNYITCKNLDAEAEAKGAKVNDKGRYVLGDKIIRNKTPDSIDDYFTSRKFTRKYLSPEEYSDFLKSKGF